MFPCVSSLSGIWVIVRLLAQVGSLCQKKKKKKWIFKSNLPNESAKGAESTTCLAGALVSEPFPWYNVLGEGCRWFWSCWQTTLPKAKLLDVFHKTHGCIPSLLLYLLRLSMLILVSLLSLSHHIAIIMQKHLTASTKRSLKKGERRIAVLYLFKHSLISTHLSKLK